MKRGEPLNPEVTQWHAFGVANGPRVGMVECIQWDALSQRWADYYTKEQFAMLPISEIYHGPVTPKAVAMSEAYTNVSKMLDAYAKIVRQEPSAKQPFMVIIDGIRARLSFLIGRDLNTP